MMVFLPGDPVGQKSLQSMFHNDDVLNHVKINGKLQNTKAVLSDSGLNKHRKPPHQQLIDDELAVWCDLQSFGFGGAINMGAGDNRSSWRFNDSYFFPTNGSGNYFHEDYLPTVIMQFNNSPDSGGSLGSMILVMTSIRTDGVDFLVHQIDDDPSPGGGEHFFLSILAIGRKGDYFS